MEKQKRISAVVLGAGVNGLGHVRSLGRMGIRPYLVHFDDRLEDLASFSKYCTPLCIRKDSFASETRLESVLVDLAEASQEKPVLFATSDYFVNYIALRREMLKKYYLFNMPDNSVIDIITNKYKTELAARNAGIKSPRTIRLTDLEPEALLSETLALPCILKPQDSYSSNFPGKNLIIRTDRELTAFNDTYPHLKDFVILQEIVPGDESNIYQCTAYFSKCGLQQFFTMQKIHQFPSGYGTTSFGRSITVQNLVDDTKRVLTNVGYTGFASVEFKKSDKDHQYYLIEINPRLPWYNSLFLSCGVNFPYLAYLDLKRTASTPVKSARQIDNVYWIHLKNEIAAIQNVRKAGAVADMSEHMKNVFRVRSFAYFDPRDLKPFYKSCIYFASLVLTKPITKRITGSGASRRSSRR